MKSFDYTITDPVGIHARPAGLLVKEVKKYESEVMIKKGEKEVDASKLMILMSLGAKQNDTVTVSVEGADEDTACEALKAYFENNL